MGKEAFDGMAYRKKVFHHYPKLKSRLLDKTIDNAVRKELHQYLKECGWLSEDNDSDSGAGFQNLIGGKRDEDR